MKHIRLLFIVLVSVNCSALVAQSILQDVQQNTSVGGYVISQVNATDQKDAEKKVDMGLRLVRLYVDSRLGDFAFKLQMQMSGNTSSLASPRIVDAWAEWQHWKELRVKFGQMKRPFTFENPMHPWVIGKGNYSQLAQKMAGFNDRTGEHASNGRDFGLQLQGDLFPVGPDRHRLVHYQAGVYNGQGINFKDKNTRKDIIGGLWVLPVKELQIGAFAWSGNYVNDAKQTIERRRVSFGVNYSGDWTARAEYGFDNANGKADAWYAVVGTPSWHRTKLFARYDVYREGKSFDASQTMYGLSAQHYLHPNLMLQFNYDYNIAQSVVGKQRYNTFDLELYWRF